MNLCEYDQWSQGEEAAIGFLRHSEIKHGRIAMFAFVGYVVQSNGIHWPWNIESSGLSFGDISAAGEGGRVMGLAAAHSLTCLHVYCMSHRVGHDLLERGVEARLAAAHVVLLAWPR